MNRRILIVDDDPTFLEMYQFLLNPPAYTEVDTNIRKMAQDPSFEITTAGNSVEAVLSVQSSLVSHLPFAGCFIDGDLNGGSTLRETLQRMVELDPQMLFVI